MSEELEILPCPQDGRKIEELTDSGEPGISVIMTSTQLWYVECCDECTGVYNFCASGKTREEAIERWNKLPRHTTAELRAVEAERNALRAELAEKDQHLTEVLEAARQNNDRLREIINIKHAEALQLQQENGRLCAAIQEALDELPGISDIEYTACEYPVKNVDALLSKALGYAPHSSHSPHQEFVSDETIEKLRMSPDDAVEVLRKLFSSKEIVPSGSNELNRWKMKYLRYIPNKSAGHDYRLGYMWCSIEINKLSEEDMYRLSMNINSIDDSSIVFYSLSDKLEVIQESYESLYKVFQKMEEVPSRQECTEISFKTGCFYEED